MRPLPRLPFRVLLADDSEIVRVRVRVLLAAVPGVDLIIEAEDAPSAIRHFDSWRPTAVVLDIQMPGGTGLDVLKWIRSRSKSCLVIMLSNCPADAYAARCLELGADFYFDKAHGFAGVAAAIAAELEMSEKVRAQRPRGGESLKSFL
jgi:DNA-binding NarL/FixJ family response regulator